MALLAPNKAYKMNSVTVYEKIIPDGTRWKNASKATKAGFAAGSLYKKQCKLTKNTGKVCSVTIHNTGDLKNVNDDAEQYTRATYNENMGSARVHFYVDDIGAWQNLKAGTGLSDNDPIGSAEVSWHAGDGSITDGGNMTSLSIEIIMNESEEHDKKAYDNGARIAAWLLFHHGLGIENLVTHTYWVNKSAGYHFDDPDVQCTHKISGKKWCPTYIFASSNEAKALENWKKFKKTTKNYLKELSDNKGQEPIAKIAKTFEPYKVKVLVDALNIRSGAGTNYSIRGNIKDHGVYTIVEETALGKGDLWGKLKSGVGWISLKYTKKL